MPDAYVFVTLNWLKGVGIDIEKWPNLTRYFQKIRQRPSVIKAFAEEGLK